VFGFDPELPAGFQDADLEMAELEAEGNRLAREEARRGSKLSLDCPTCGAEDVLSPRQAARGYQCNRCADADDPDGAGSYYG
jgi:predicted RNA-binding Zn-ribbon protein involved in translation (DUF1610 family)